MMKLISFSDRRFKTALQRLCNRSQLANPATEASVKRILQAVQRTGDRAVARYTLQYDRATIQPETFRISEEEIKGAYYHIRKDEGDTLRYVAQRIRAFHERQTPNTMMYQENGIKLGRMSVPLDSVGLYVPGGKAVYPSSALMNAIPAKMAGVKRVVMCTPSHKGEVNPYLLVAADIAGVDELYRIGGVQAIGAMAYGTKTIPKVDKIIGPGNIYVATAKRLVFGHVGIDSIAGPSELLIIADARANAEYIAADLLCEAEHDEEASVILLTPSTALANAVIKQVEKKLKPLSRRTIATRAINRHGTVLVVQDMDHAIELGNLIAPEHMGLHVATPFELIERIRHTGVVFLGEHTPPAIGDYVAGPNHVLPTGGTARFSSGLSSQDFMKWVNFVSYSKNEVSKANDHVMRMATMEGLTAHAQCVQVRTR
tara:strand:- start:1320 stop:2606 length:1287 start_codon:yes stop_codon:yes gene_type:complete